MHCWFQYDATKPGVTENRICEGADCLKAALSSAITGLQVMVAAATGVGKGGNEVLTFAVSRTLSKHSDIQ